jgi:hypothetical protein
VAIYWPLPRLRGHSREPHLPLRTLYRFHNMSSQCKWLWRHHHHNYLSLLQQNCECRNNINPMSCLKQIMGWDYFILQSRNLTGIWHFQLTETHFHDRLALPGRFLFPQETGTHSLQIRRLNIFEFKGATQNQNGIFNTTIVYHGLPITGTLQITKSQFASGWCPPILSIFVLAMNTTT